MSLTYDELGWTISTPALHGFVRLVNSDASFHAERPVESTVCVAFGQTSFNAMGDHGAEMTDPKRCPLCGETNECGRAAGKETCWCFSECMPRELLERVPESARVLCT